MGGQTVCEVCMGLSSYSVLPAINTCNCAAAQHISLLPLLCIHQLRSFHPGVAFFFVFQLWFFLWVCLTSFHARLLASISLISALFQPPRRCLYRSRLLSPSLFPVTALFFFFFVLISMFAFVLSPSLLFILFTSPLLKFHHFLLCASFPVCRSLSLSLLPHCEPPSSPLPPHLPSPLSLVW